MKAKEFDPPRPASYDDLVKRAGPLYAQQENLLSRLKTGRVDIISANLEGWMLTAKFKWYLFWYQTLTGDKVSQTDIMSDVKDLRKEKNGQII